MASSGAEYSNENLTAFVAQVFRCLYMVHVAKEQIGPTSERAALLVQAKAKLAEAFERYIEAI